MKKNKLHLGKKTLNSIAEQISIILASQFGKPVQLGRLHPHRRDAGNFVAAEFTVPEEPNPSRSRLFAIQRIGDCCDVWLEGPAELTAANSNNPAA